MDAITLLKFLEVVINNLKRESVKKDVFYSISLDEIPIGNMSTETVTTLIERIMSKNLCLYEGLGEKDGILDEPCIFKNTEYNLWIKIDRFSVPTWGLEVTHGYTLMAEEVLEYNDF